MARKKESLRYCAKVGVGHLSHDGKPRTDAVPGKRYRGQAECGLRGEQEIEVGEFGEGAEVAVAGDEPIGDPLSSVIF